MNKIVCDESSSQKYSDVFEEYNSSKESLSKDVTVKIIQHLVAPETFIKSKKSAFEEVFLDSGEKNATKFIETYFYKVILRIQDNEVFSTVVLIYETIVYALSYEEHISKGIKTILENTKTFKFYGKELENIFMSLEINEENIFDEHCKIDFLRNKIVILNSEKIEVNKISMSEEGHKE